MPVASDVITELEGRPDPTLSVLFVTIWELGEATGPLFLAPLSELYGRFVVYNVANCFFITGIVITALSQSIGLLVFARFLTGCAVAANVLNPAIIGDIFPSESRGAAMSAVMLAPLIGGALGYDYFPLCLIPCTKTLLTLSRFQADLFRLFGGSHGLAYSIMAVCGCSWRDRSHFHQLFPGVLPSYNLETARRKETQRDWRQFLHDGIRRSSTKCVLDAHAVHASSPTHRLELFNATVHVSVGRSNVCLFLRQLDRSSGDFSCCLRF